MKPILGSCAFFAAVVLFASHSTAQQKSAVRSKTDEGFWYLRKSNPQKISHYMREAGLTYLEAARADYEAEIEYGARLSDETKSASEIADDTLVKLQDRKKINTQAPADKDFLAVLIHTGQMASLAGSGVGLCASDAKPQKECDKYLSRYIGCRSWAKESIDSGVFDDSWHADCYGDWTEEHEAN